MVFGWLVGFWNEILMMFWWVGFLGKRYVGSLFYLWCVGDDDVKEEVSLMLVNMGFEFYWLGY